MKTNQIHKIKVSRHLKIVVKRLRQRMLTLMSLINCLKHTNENILLEVLHLEKRNKK